MTIKQKLFTRVYLKSLNATEAALAVYQAKNRQSAAVIGSRLLRNVNVQTEINTALKASGVTLESAINNLVKIASSEPEKVTARDKLNANIEILKLLGHTSLPPK